MYLDWMGCCGSTPDDEPLDPDYVRFRDMYTDGVISVGVLADSMGLSRVSMGRKLSGWGYHTERRYLGGKRERVVVGVKVI